MPPDEPERPALRALASANFAVGIMSYGLVGALPVLASAWRITPGQAAMLLATFSIAYAVGAPLVQIVLGRTPRRRLLLMGVAVLAGATLTGAAVSSFGGLLATRIVAGLSAGAVAPVAQAIAIGLTPVERRGRALAVVFAGVTLSSVIAAPLMALVAHLCGWRAVFVGVASLTAASGLWMANAVHDSSCGERMPPARLLRLALRPATATGLAVTVLQTAAFFATYTLALPLASDRFGASASQGAFALLAYGVVGMAGNLLAQHLSLRYAADGLIRVVLLIMLPLFATLALLGNLQGNDGLRQAIALFLLLIWALMQDLFFPSQLRRLVALEADVHGMIIALNSSSIFVGISLGSAMGGHMADHPGLKMLPSLSALLTLLAFGALLASQRLQMCRARIRPDLKSTASATMNPPKCEPPSRPS